MARMYAYFQKQNGKWIRQIGPALSKEYAIRYYQDRLIYLGGCLRAVAKDK